MHLPTTVDGERIDWARKSRAQLEAELIRSRANCDNHRNELKRYKRKLSIDLDLLPARELKWLKDQVRHGVTLTDLIGAIIKDAYAEENEQ